MLDERSLTKGEDKKKEKYVKGMKKSFSDFKSRYGDDAKSVMYATATKMAKEQNYDKFDRTVRAAGAVKNPQTKIKLLKVAAQQRPKVAEDIQEIAPVVAGAAAVGKMAAKQAAKKGARKAAGMVASKAVGAGQIKTGSVASTSKVTGKSSTQQSSAIVKSKPGMQSKKAPSVPKKAEGGTVDKTGMTSTRSGSSSYTPGSDKKKPEEKDKKKETKKSGISGDTVKKKVRSAAGQLQGIFEPKENYEQDGELLTFSDFREIVTVCNSDEESVNEGAAWTKKAGKNSEGGLNEKGRKSYEKENPGSDLKAPSKKVGNPRRASFCARMKGMKKKLTSKKTASDPDSRINKSLRAWNC